MTNKNEQEHVGEAIRMKGLGNVGVVGQQFQPTKHASKWRGLTGSWPVSRTCTTPPQTDVSSNMIGHKTTVLRLPTRAYLKASGEFQVIFNLFAASQPVRHLDQSRDIMVPGVAG